MNFQILNNFNDTLVKNFYKELEHDNISASINNTFLWNESFWNVFSKVEDDEFGYAPELYIILGTDGHNEKKLVLPLIKRTLSYGNSLGMFSVHLKTLSICGDYWGVAFQDILSKNISPSDIEELLKFIHNNISYDILWFSHIKEDSLLLRNGHGILISGCPCLNLQQYSNYEAYRRVVYSKKLKYNTKGLRIKLEKEIGTIKSLSVSCSDPSFPWDDLIDTSLSKTQTGKHSLYLSPHKYNFIKQICLKFESTGIFVYFKNQCAAYRLFLKHNGWHYDLDASYNRKFPQGAGIISYDDAIKFSFKNNMNIHFGGTGIDEYKLKFLKKILLLYDVIIPGSTIKGKIMTYVITKKMTIHSGKFLKELNIRKEKYHAY